MPRITLEEVEYVAQLARLELTEAEKRTLTEQLGRILDYIAKLNELNTDAVEPTSHVLPIRNIFREDEARDPMPREEALRLAPARHDGYYEVPRVIE
ncbi:MAG: aspartyl/glutamyl-tRNA(Asn/Gln) amidotransferase subunit C [Candidatus Poribacteria bacterium]|nr:MAG: aspartyl/glutamyl-tRNA(Asn/Gln) amidotransferase subunit C [Candidatus Poribacteria bacterium]